MAFVPTDRDLTFMAFMQRFSTPASCLKHLEAIRWREGEFCPKCEFVGQFETHIKRSAPCSSKFWEIIDGFQYHGFVRRI